MGKQNSSGLYKVEYMQDLAYPSTDGQTFANGGLTALDHFAGLAMQSLIMHPDKRKNPTTSTIAFRAERAYAQAAAMIEERKKYLTK